MAFLYKSEPVRGTAWARIFAQRLPDLPFRIWPDTGREEDIRFMAAWTLPEDLARFRNLELLFSIGAGVDQFDLAGLPAALGSGWISAAVLDVADPEPLPEGRPFWSHPRIWLTPHIASTTQPDSGAEAVIANIHRHVRGERLAGLVDRVHGY